MGVMQSLIRGRYLLAVALAGTAGLSAIGAAAVAQLRSSGTAPSLPWPPTAAPDVWTAPPPGAMPPASVPEPVPVGQP